MQVNVNRTDVKFYPDSSRVIARFPETPDKKSKNIIRRVMSLSDKEVEITLNQVFKGYSGRHRNISKIFEKHFEELYPLFKQMDIDPGSFDDLRKALIGSYFTMEYSIESAALFNPSIVEHPDQTNLPAGAKRVMVSLRATGEGHISSIVFRCGIIDKDDKLVFDPAGKLPEEAENIKSLASSHYEIEFSGDTLASERVIFPMDKSEKGGIEDARFVKFTDDDGRISYYATYTAYDSTTIMPKLIETDSFSRFKIMPVQGELATNKGMALFPRKIKGKYAMLCRIDNENNYIAFSDSINIWRDAKILQSPEYPWELKQLGNCGSPIETEAGWLVITHAVGPMREYVLGAVLLDLDDPEKVIGRSKTPLMTPSSEEREGYVPNVVYSCGSIVHNNKLVIPYAMSDYASSFAFVNLDELLEELKNSG